MDVFTKDELATLTRISGEWCVSIYMPTHRVGQGTQADPIRLRNLLDEAEKHLTAGGLRTPEVESLLGPARGLVQNGLFWQYQSDGLVIFLASGMFRRYRLPFNFEALVVVTDRFHVKPLLPLLSGDGRFYVLALSQREVRLLQGTRYSIGDVDLEGIPSGLADALRYDDPERQLQFHTGTRGPGGVGERPATFHGQGVGSNDEKENILRYFHKVDSGLHVLLRDEHAPLVLAGVDYLLPVYSEANTYPHLVEKGIEGNPDEVSADELQRQAWAIVQPLFVAAQKEAAARCRQLEGEGSAQVSSDLRGVVRAAHYGRVETLFVALGVQCWGSFDPGTGAVQPRREAKPGDEDLLDLAAVQTLLNGGMVYAVEPERVPGEGSIAAVFRY
jgi:hypothetical protein